MSTPTPQEDDRGSRRTITGTVTSDKMEKTVVVTVIRRVRDRRFHKFVTRRVKYKAHDESNNVKSGDVVEIIESRPMSRTKRWRVIRTISSNKEGLSGNTRIYILPSFFTDREIAIRAASICRAVIQPGSITCKPKSPKETSLPPFERPAR